MKQQSASMDWLVGSGEMAHLMRSHDWEQTPLGSVAQWPQSLRSALSILLPSKAQICLFWGSEFITFYNDAYRPVFGAKHPQALGMSAKDCWSEIWSDVLGPLFQNVVDTGESFWGTDYPFFLARNGYLEETYFDISYDPVRDESGQVGGVFCIVSETTVRVLGERRLRTLRELATNTAAAKETAEVCRIAMQTLMHYPQDVPFALLYQMEPTGTEARLIEAVGLAAGSPSSPLTIDLTQATDPWLLAQVHQTGEATIVHGFMPSQTRLPSNDWSDAPDTALVMPLSTLIADAPSREFLVMGVSSRRAFDDAYRGFFELVASNMATAISNAHAYEIERQRAESLAAIDRAKTVFFSNVSHEFRTPLTLMLAPIEDALADSEHPLSPIQRDRVAMVQRNSLRLLKLVNTLLDFSRIEAGRIQAAYEPTDLAAYTAELASTFRSLIERAGMALVVECTPSTDTVYVDRDMWEKIVLNLLSNAFKFTFTGTITVRLNQVGQQIQLAIADTGIGIPPKEMPHLFERFYRVKGAQGRSFEGSGIGLALVQELVSLHGGTITASSTYGQGSCFTVSLPTGAAHLPQNGLRATRTLRSTAMGAVPYLEEALRWLPEAGRSLEGLMGHTEALIPSHPALSPSPPLPVPPSPLPRYHILIADDNADMRDYVKRLLEQRYSVEAVEDGMTALQAIHQHQPDLVLTDVMMPRLDGFGLLRALRTEPQTQELPIILLSARAGEEARIEGLKAGADDYLIKPFSQRELLARIEACLKMAQFRREVAEREQALRHAAERAQREAEMNAERLNHILESMMDGFIALDKDWRIIYQNAAAEQINASKPRSQVLGKTHWEEWPASAGSEMERQYRHALAEQVPVRFEHHYYEPAKFDLWVEIQAYPFDGGLGLFFRNITHRKQIELAIQEQEERLRLFFKYVPSGVAMFDRQMCYLMANQRWLDDYGLESLESVLGRSHYDLFPEISERWTQIHQRCLAGATERCEADRFERQDWRVQWLRWEVRPWYQPDQSIGGIIIFSEEITKRQEAEIALQESQLLLQQQLAEIEAIYQSAPIGLNVLDTNLRFVRINQRLAEINGLPVEAHLGRTVRELLPELADASEQLLRPILETGEPLLNVEITGETPAQQGIQRIWLEHFLPLKSGDRVIGINTVCEEITDRKRLEADRNRAEAALRKAKEELEIRVAERTAELRQKNAELQQSESTLRSFFNSGGVMMAIVEMHDNDIRYISANHATAEFLGTTPEALENQFVSDLGRSQQTIQQILEYYRKAQSLQAPVRLEYCYDQGEEPRWLSVSLCPTAVSSSGYPRFSFIAKDVTDRKRAEATLADREEQLRLTLEFTHIGTWDWSLHTNDLIWNNNHFRLMGLEPSPTALYQLWRNVIHPDDIERVEQALLKALADHTDYEAEYRVVYPDGTLRWLVGKGRGVYDEAGTPIRMLGVILDVSDRKQAEQLLELQAVITRNMAEGICLVRADNGIMVYANPKFEQMFGYGPGELQDRHVSIVNYATDPGGAEAVNQAIRSAVLQSGESTYEVYNVKKDGTPFWCRATACTFKHPYYGDVLVAVQQDITDRKQAEERIAASLKEKEVLLKEIHHRVKNNLGIVSSLLQMQERRTQVPQARAILKDSQNRIGSIALVHEKLYRSADLASVDFSQYLQDLTTYLFDSYNISANQVTLDIQVEPVSLEIETAIPCGLIVNELVSNALKHAFPDQQTGTIQVRLTPAVNSASTEEAQRLFTLSVRDTGIGLADDFDLAQANTLGLSLVHGLVAQIRGSIEIARTQGTEFKITFMGNSL